LTPDEIQVLILDSYVEGYEDAPGYIPWKAILKAGMVGGLLHYLGPIFDAPDS
jgi:hypothetical protein